MGNTESKSVVNLPHQQQEQEQQKLAPSGYIQGSLLRETDCIFIDTLLRNSKRTGTPVWQRLYSSEVDGKSWTIFRSAVFAAEKSLILFKDKENDQCVFGGFFPKPLIASVKFQEDSDAFAFQVSSEELKLYFPTGLNRNHIYFNHGSKSFPNGIGMGGQIDYFGFFVFADFETGACRAEPTSTTFGFPQLSGKADFFLDRCEVWMLEPRDIDSIEFKRTIRDNADAIAILELAGKEFHSQNIAPPPPTPADC